MRKRDEQFYTKKARSELSQLRERIAELDKKIKPLAKERSDLAKKIGKIQDAQERAKLKAKGILDWGWILWCDGGSVSDERYEYMKKRVEELGLYSNGYNPDIKQRCVDIYYRYVIEDRAKVLAGLKTILPHLKSDNYDKISELPTGKYKRIHLMGPDCSEKGSQCILFGEDEIIYGATVWHHWREFAKWPAEKFDEAMNAIFDALVKDADKDACE